MTDDTTTLTGGPDTVDHAPTDAAGGFTCEVCGVTFWHGDDFRDKLDARMEIRNHVTNHASNGDLDALANAGDHYHEVVAAPGA